MFRLPSLCTTSRWFNHISALQSSQKVLSLSLPTQRCFSSRENIDIEEKAIGSKEESFHFNEEKFKILVRHRFLFDQSYEIYGGASGLIDLGPVGCALKTNILKFWRRFFVLEEQMLEIECPTLTIEPVFKASGHIQRFNDYLVKDVRTGESFRLDHLIKAHLEALCAKTDDLNETSVYADAIATLDGKCKAELTALLREYAIKSPSTGNDLTDPIDYNLMFDTQLGPSTTTRCFLRPETSQGIFVNFKRLLNYNHGQVPFSVAQIGNAFRNEIAPRGGLLRVREFTIAEIEHFLDPNDKSHSKFTQVENTEVKLLSACHQMDSESAIRTTIGEAVKKGLIANETLGYFIARIQMFLLRIGIAPNRLRFRQHMSNEMAHYAVDCWDAECLTSHGWIECVGCADRSAYDLMKHASISGVNLSASRIISTPKEIDTMEIVANGEFLKKLKPKTKKATIKSLTNLSLEECETFLRSLENNGYFELQVNDKQLKIHKSDVEVKNVKRTVHIETFTPNVIEPSFGIGRIMYALLEHSFRTRGAGDGNSYFALPPLIAPHKCAVLPLVHKPQLQEYVKRISCDLIENDISHKVEDLNGSIGRRYIRCDEIGIPISVTVDYDTLDEPHTVTMRERESKDQLRVPIEDVSEIIRKLFNEKFDWKYLCEKYPKYEKSKSPE